MILSKKALSRRTVLRGMGTAIALPLLDAMVPAMTALADTPASPSPAASAGIRLHADGLRRHALGPARCDDLSQLSPTLSPLEPIRQHVTAISGLELKNAYPGNSCHVQFGVPELRHSQTHGKHGLFSGHHRRSDRRTEDRSDDSAAIT